MNFEILLAFLEFAKPLYRSKSWRPVINYLDEILFLYNFAWIQIDESLDPEQSLPRFSTDYSSIWTHKVHIRRAA